MKNPPYKRQQWGSLLAMILTLAFLVTVESFGTPNPPQTTCEFLYESKECDTAGSVSLKAPTLPAIYTCVDSSTSITAEKEITQGYIDVTKHFLNCPDETTGTFVDPVHNVTWAVTGVTAEPSSGSGLTAVFTPQELRIGHCYIQLHLFDAAL